MAGFIDYCWFLVYWVADQADLANLTVGQMLSPGKGILVLKTFENFQKVSHHMEFFQRTVEAAALKF